jgi:hypothetical protein
MNTPIFLRIRFKRAGRVKLTHYKYLSFTVLSGSINDLLK